MARTFGRSSTKITISEFYDNYKLGKYNFNAEYQRKSDVWLEDKQSFLIDSIFKNYPIPALFMRPIIDDEGRTIYDIIDGKQRLQTIIKFIEGKIPLTSYFGEDDFFSESEKEKIEQMSSSFFYDIKNNKIFVDYIKQFWTYPLQVEYLYEENGELISNVFDRLNRNGEPLNRQELRNAKYGKTLFLQKVRDLSKVPFLHDKLKRLKIERMEDDEFVSELLILILDNDIQDSSPNIIDEKYDKYKDDEANIEQAGNIFVKIIHFMEKLELNFDTLKRLSWTTHLYTLFSVCWYCEKNQVKVDDVKEKINDFYNSYFSRNTVYEGSLKDYKTAASSRTRSAAQRKNRMSAILQYCGICVSPLENL